MANDDSRLSPQQRTALERTCARLAREEAAAKGLTGEALDEEAARLYVEMVKGGGVESDNV